MDYPIGKRLEAIRKRIDAACETAGRSLGSVTLVGISKKQPVQKMVQFLEAARRMSIRPVIGENYIQEFEAKRGALSELTFESHFTGTLQSNKVQAAVRLFDVIETIHSEKIAGAVAKEAEKAGKTQRVYLQVNVSADPAKSGFSSEEALSFLRNVAPSLASVRIEGLMAITALYDDPESARPDFAALREVLAECRQDSSVAAVMQGDALSMGMSNDFQIAIEEGATHIRIGTALFGDRP